MQDQPQREPVANSKTDGLTRREVVRRALLASGFALTAGNAALVTACSSSRDRTESARFTPFTDGDIAWLDEVAETILPATETPGAKAAEVGAFIALMVTDSYTPEDRVRFRSGMDSLESECVETAGVGFLEASPAQRLELLERLDQEQFDQFRADPDAPAHPFRPIKELTLLGYFTSEIGYTQAMRYAETPGRYEPCAPYVEGETSWARHA